MPTFRIVGLDALPLPLEEFLLQAAAVLGEELRLEVAEEGISELETLSPVKTGKYRASHTPAVGEVVTRRLPNLPAYPIDGIARVQEALAGAPPSSVVYIANAVESKEGAGSYADILERGKSRMAPGGIYGPAVPALQARRATIVANAIARTRARLG